MPGSTVSKIVSVIRCTLVRLSLSLISPTRQEYIETLLGMATSAWQTETEALIGTLLRISNLPVDARYVRQRIAIRLGLFLVKTLIMSNDLVF